MKRVMLNFVLMASAFSHALVGLALGKNYRHKRNSTKFLILGCTCALIPDLDVMMFRFVPYEHPLGHRGFFHSLVFCLILSFIITLIFYGKEKLNSSQGKMLFLYFFLCGASHGLLDMLTNGGLGVALFSPFDNTRYFFPYRPIQVSPIGVGNFFSKWGLKVIRSELVWIVLPCFIYMILGSIIRRNKKDKLSH